MTLRLTRKRVSLVTASGPLFDFFLLEESLVRIAAQCSAFAFYIFFNFIFLIWETTAEGVASFLLRSAYHISQFFPLYFPSSLKNALRVRNATAVSRDI